MHTLHPFFLQLSQLQPWIESWLSTAGPIVVFVVTFIEGIPPIGLLVPSHTIVLFAAFLAKIGVLRFDVVVVAAICGMFLGDCVGYFLGRRFGYAFILPVTRMFSVREKSVEKVKGLVSGHLSKAVFIGKYNPLTRPFTPFIVGASKISMMRFIISDFLCDISLVILVSIVGYAFGASYGLAAMYLGRIIIIGLILAVLVTISYRFINSQFHIFARYELFALILNILALVGFVSMLQGISGMNHFMLGPDIVVNVWSYDLAGTMPWIVGVSSLVSAIFGPVLLSMIVVAVSVYFFVKKRWRYLIITLSSVVGGYAIVDYLKNIIASPRPPDAFVHLTDYSFPSGHAAAAGIALVLGIYFLAPTIKSKSSRWLLVVGLSVIALSVGASRLVLDVHWLSDVIAGYSFGIFWTTLMILIVRYGGLVWKAISEIP